MLTHRAPNTVKKYLNVQAEPDYRRSIQPKPQLGPFLVLIEQWLVLYVKGNQTNLGSNVTALSYQTSKCGHRCGHDYLVCLKFALE